MNISLNNRNFEFTTNDILDIEFGEKDLLILDPPYILRDDMYTMNFNKNHNEFLLNILNENKCDFIYFNYLERDGVVYDELNDIIAKKDYKIIELANKTSSGQNRNGGKCVKEILITNIE